MQYRILGKTGLRVSEVSLGTWQVGGKWGSGFDHKLAANILGEAIDHGVNFIDTADVYEDGESEIAVGKAIRGSSSDIHVATKCGRKLNPHVANAYTPEVLEKFVDESLKRLHLETIDLIQLHCPPTKVYYRPEIFEAFERMREKGKILNLGVSVEKVEQALKAIEYPNVTTVQIIFNVFRQRPAELFFSEARKRKIGVIVRVPLASGLLTGRYTASTEFESGDHRNFNRDGAGFDRGETFSGVDYDTGLRAVEEIKQIFPGEDNLAPRALQWILKYPEVSTVIPGASRPDQVLSNLSVYDYPVLSDSQVDRLNEVYSKYIKSSVHHLW